MKAAAHQPPTQGAEPKQRPSQAALFSAHGLHKAFGPVPVLKGVSLEVLAGEVHALVGENGSGKSTLLNLMAGLLQPDAGEMRMADQPWQPQSTRQARAGGVAFIQQELNLFGELSLTDNLFLVGRPAPPSTWRLPWPGRRQRRDQAQAWLAEVGLFRPADTLCHRLSAGERQLLEVAKALAARARLLLFDEPTTSLSQPERERLFGLIRRLRAAGCGVVYVSHVLPDVFQLADRLTLLRDGRQVGALLPPDMQAPRVIEAISSRGRRSADDHLNAAAPGRVDPHRARQGPRDAASPGSAFVQPVPGQPLLEVNRLTRRGAVEDASFTLQAGEVLGLAGLMGAGRTELVRLLFGLDRWDAGEVRICGTRLRPGRIGERLAAGMALLVEDRQREGLLPEASVQANMALAALPRFCRGPLRWLDRPLQARATRQAAEAVALQPATTAALLAPVRQLSGGNQQKSLLGRWLLRQPRLWLLDEPTRGVDVNARDDIHRWVRAQAAAGAGVLVISSEHDELTALCDRLLVMRQGRLVAEFAREAFDAGRILQAALQPGHSPARQPVAQPPHQPTATPAQPGTVRDTAPSPPGLP